jgi:dipeptidase D
MSKHEGAILSLLKSVAGSHGLAWTQDAAGNLLIKAPGRGVGEHAPPVLIQGHVDMVTEKNQATVHDFLTDPIALKRSSDGG